MQCSAPSPRGPVSTWLGAVQWLPCSEIFKPGALDELGEVLERKQLSAGSKQQFLHIFPTDSETSTCDAGDDFKPRSIARNSTLHGKRAEVLHARDFVPSRSIILGNFSLDDD